MRGQRPRRTLHHFDVVGVLRPTERSAGGHRLYTADDARRLYRVLVLRYLGLSLADVARSLDAAPEELGVIIRRQRAAIERDLASLRDQLTGLNQALRDSRDPGIDELFAAMEAMMKSSYFTPEQLAAARARHGEADFDDWQDRCRRLVAALRPHVEAGTDPADPEVQRLAGRWRDVVDEMTAGGRGMRSAMYARMDGQGAERATRGLVDPESWAYLKRAFAVGF
ncbi:MerR family transcriptional regulator [Cryptosporangium phraense]|uniref:MerR family transcriptional regulator n=1 Tax=Cryptosporangium phraense TaxID=2593070 RepID=A0A545AMD6_9ACTN|nr:MerR family transcriptional regulator [Cryptosporangium phraense]TQS42509.1 MerR family transcriptional regulator [Cryptosporangium phraense]